MDRRRKTHPHFPTCPPLEDDDSDEDEDFKSTPPPPPPPPPQTLWDESTQTRTQSKDDQDSEGDFISPHHHDLMTNLLHFLSQPHPKNLKSYPDPDENKLQLKLNELTTNTIKNDVQVYVVHEKSKKGKKRVPPSTLAALDIPPVITLTDTPDHSPASSVISIRNKRIRKISGPTKVLVVQREDDGFHSKHDVNGHAMDIRLERDNFSALQVLTLLRTPPGTSNHGSEFEMREQYYRRRHLLAWHAAISMPRNKKIPCETKIPVSATRYLKRKPTKCERIRRYIIKLLRCGGDGLYVQDVVTQHSIDRFNNDYIKMKNLEILPGFGIKTRNNLFDLKNIHQLSHHNHRNDPT